MRLILPGEFTGTTTYRVAYSDLWVNYPRPSRLVGEGSYRMGATEADFNPSDLPRLPNGDVNYEVLDKIIRAYSLHMADTYNIAMYRIGTDASDMINSGRLPNDDALTFGFYRYAEVDPSTGDKLIPAEMEAWISLGEGYNAAVDTGTVSDWEATPFVDTFGISVEGSNADVFWSLCTPEIKELIMLRLQTILFSEIGGVGLSSFFHTYYTQPNVDVSASDMLIGIVGSAIRIIDALFIQRQTFVSAHAINWDMKSQIDQINEFFKMHPEYSGSFDTIFYEPNPDQDCISFIFNMFPI